jgi:hypothetical protein
MRVMGRLYSTTILNSESMHFELGNFEIGKLGN